MEYGDEASQRLVDSRSAWMITLLLLFSCILHPVFFPPSVHAAGKTEGHFVQNDPYTGERWFGPIQDLVPDGTGAWHGFWHEQLPTGHKRSPAVVSIVINGKWLTVREEKYGELWKGTWRREGNDLQATGRWLTHDEAGTRDLGTKIRRRRKFDLRLTLPPGNLPVHPRQHSEEIFDMDEPATTGETELK